MAFQSFEDEDKKKEAESLAAQMTAAAPKVEEPEDSGYEMSSNDLISQAILQIAPSILGAAIGGSGGAQVGIQAGQQGFNAFKGIRESQSKQELAKSKLAAEKAKAQQEAQFKAAELGIKGQESAAKIKELQNKGKEDSGKMKSETNKLEMDLFKEFNADTRIKKHRIIAQKAAEIDLMAQDPSAQANMSVITNFAKLLDPDSVVRESEFQSAANTMGGIDKTVSLWDRWRSGKPIDQKTAMKFAEVAKKIAANSAIEYNAAVQDYTDRAQKYGADPKYVIGRAPDYAGAKKVTPIDGSTGVVAPAPEAPMISEKDKQALDWANSNPEDPRAAAIKKRLGV
jgi:hypothetical protein